MDIKILTDFEQIYRLKEHWRQLAEKSSHRSIFSFPEWSIAWLKSYGKAGRPYIICAWDGSELVGVLPLFARRGKPEDLFLSRLEPIGGVQADYHTPIIQKGSESIIFEDLMEAVPETNKRLFFWPHVPENHPSLALFREYFRKKGWPWHETNSICPYYQLPDSFKDVLESISSKHRRNLKVSIKKAEKFGDVKLEFINNNKDSINIYLNDFFNAHTKKWLAENKPAMFVSNKNKRFYHNLVNELPFKNISLSCITLNDKRISYLFGFFHNGWLLGYTNTYCKEYSSISPNKIHFNFIMEHGCSQGWKGIDFMQGDEAYKFYWTRTYLNCVSLYAGMNGGGLGYRWATFFKPRYWNKIEPIYNKLIYLYKRVKWNDNK